MAPYLVSWIRTSFELPQNMHKETLNIMLNYGQKYVVKGSLYCRWILLGIVFKTDTNNL